MKLIKVAVDGSRVRSGGGIAHLLGIFEITDPTEFGIAEIHVFSYQKLLDQLPQHPWLIKHHPPALERSLFQQSWWQGRHLRKEIEQAGCEILFSADVSTFCRFKPLVVLNQNMLAYDPGVLALFGLSKERIKQTLMYFVQRQAFRFAQGTIFLTQHAAQQVQRRVGPLKRTVCIPHGVAEIFKQTPAVPSWPTAGERPIRCLYVSPVLEYKHQTEVVRAIKVLREQGLNIELTLAGGGGQRPLKIMSQLLDQVDPQREFVKAIEFIPNAEVASLIANADLFVFASGCETFGIALLEAMAVGVPIACSNRSSLPETLKDGGEYFDPQDPQSIAQAITRLVTDPQNRVRRADRAKALAAQYSWPRCAAVTWQFVVQTYHELDLKTAA
jgi:glycosyltransferase involved in cell wall biosynthesis